MEPEEEVQRPFTSCSLGDDSVPTARRTSASRQCHAVEGQYEQRRQGRLTAVHGPLTNTYTAGASTPADAAGTPLPGMCCVRQPGVPLSSQREGGIFGSRETPSVRLPGEDPPVDQVSMGTAIASTCSYDTFRTADVDADNAANLPAAAKNFSKEPSQNLRSVSPEENWWLPHADKGTAPLRNCSLHKNQSKFAEVVPLLQHECSRYDDPGTEYEERAGVVSRVLQVLRCESLLREAREALQAARAEMMDVDVQFCAGDVERSLPAGQGDKAAPLAVQADDCEMLMREKSRQPRHFLVEGTAGAEIAATEVNHQARGFSTFGAASKPTGGEFDKATALVLSTKKDITSSEQTVSSTEGMLVTGVSAAEQHVKNSFETQLVSTREPNPVAAECKSTSEANWQTATERGEARRSVWMRGETSESDILDDPKIRALRALIPELLTNLPEWLDAKLDTGRRGEWLGFQKILPVILEQRFGLMSNDLCKDGPFCWKGKRQTSAAEANNLFLSAADTKGSQATPCNSGQHGGEKASFFHPCTRCQGTLLQLPDTKQAQHHLQAQVSRSEKQLQPLRQQTVSAGLLLLDKRMEAPVFAQCLSSKELSQEERRCHMSEAMDVDGESDENLSMGEVKFCKGTSDDKVDFRVGSRSSSSSNARALNPAESVFCPKPDSHLQRESDGPMQPREETVALLEVTSVWVNGFRESGKPYDVHVQARVDGRIARHLYIEIKATVAAKPCFVLSLPQLEFARLHGPDNYLVLMISSIRTANPTWLVLDNVAERVNRSLRLPLPSTENLPPGQAKTAAARLVLPSDLKIRCRFKEQLTTSNPAARGQLAEQNIDDLLGCLLKPSC